MTLDPLGNIVLDSQAHQHLIIVSSPGSSKQTVLRLPLSYLASGTPKPIETDDTTFVTSSEGFILIADKKLNTVYKLSKKPSHRVPPTPRQTEVRLLAPWT